MSESEKMPESEKDQLIDAQKEVIGILPIILSIDFG